MLGVLMVWAILIALIISLILLAVCLVYCADLTQAEKAHRQSVCKPEKSVGLSRRELNRILKEMERYQRTHYMPCSRRFK